MVQLHSRMSSAALPRVDCWFWLSLRWIDCFHYVLLVDTVGLGQYRSEISGETLLEFQLKYCEIYIEVSREVSD